MPRAFRAAIRWSSLARATGSNALVSSRRVVEEAPVGPERRVEVAEPDQVDPRPGQAIGQGVGLLAVEEGRRGQQRDAEEPGPAPLREGEPAVA